MERQRGSVGGSSCRFIYTYGISENTRRVQGLSRNRAETADLWSTVQRAATCDTPQGDTRIYNPHLPVASSFPEHRRVVEEREDIDHAFFFKKKDKAKNTRKRTNYILKAGRIVKLGAFPLRGVGVALHNLGSVGHISAVGRPLRIALFRQLYLHYWSSGNIGTPDNE